MFISQVRIDKAAVVFDAEIPINFALIFHFHPFVDMFFEILGHGGTVAEA